MRKQQRFGEAIYGAIMLIALLALFSHQHVDADDANHCPASAWHLATIDSAPVQIDIPKPALNPAPEVQAFDTVASRNNTRVALPRAPPSQSH